jgi:hypothetical protein
MALLVSALLPLPLLLPHGPDLAPAPAEGERVTVLRLLPLAARPAPSAPTTAPAPAALDRRPSATESPVSASRPRAVQPDAVQSISAPRTASTPAPAGVETVRAPGEGDSPTPAAPAAPAVPTLRLDDTVIRIAAREALNPLRGGAGPRLVEPEALSAAERLGREVAEAGKPDCVRPGGSLLSLPLVLFELVSDRCR